jgi:hypothetical protein
MLAKHFATLSPNASGMGTGLRTPGGLGNVHYMAKVLPKVRGRHGHL